MVSKSEINAVLNKMIISASGWRGVFAENGDEESKFAQISAAYSFISGAAAFVFAEFLQKLKENTIILVGIDARPTGPAIASSVISVLNACDCDVRFAGVTASPEVMAWARSMDSPSKNCGFIYISASHNPIGHNGFKFGLTDGGVLAAGESNKLIADFKTFLNNEKNISKIESLLIADNSSAPSCLCAVSSQKDEAFKAYYDFCGKVVFDGQKKGGPSIAAAIKTGLEKRPLGIVCDFNGSARTVSIDRVFFSALGLKFCCINGESGQIVHRIVPEGESLEPCRAFLEEAHARDNSFLLGYVPDCDGDRGNLVIWDDAVNRARSLEAQEVFALACAAELAHLVWTGELQITGGKGSGGAIKAAIAVNDPTSLRIDRIAAAFGVSVFRAEVGEANVVGLARRLREQGYTVRILGEGSAGGTITHPSAVRDPIHTVLAIVKFLSIRSDSGIPGYYEIWRNASGQPEKYRSDFTLSDVIASLPQFSTTGAYSEEALMQTAEKDHSLLKERYGAIFLREWEERKDELKMRYGIHNWEAAAYNGMEEKRQLIHFGDAGKGGLKILFYNSEGKSIASIWMRGSATEPVFRIIADASEKQLERELIAWQRRMILAADS